MHLRKKQEKKFPPPLYAAFFLALLLCAAVYMAAAVRLWQSWTTHEAANQTLKVIADTAGNAAPSRSPLSAVHEMVKSFKTAAEEVQPIEVIEAEETPQLDTEAPIAIDFDALLAVNGDVVGWLYCSGTSINFPILQTPEHEKYPDSLFVDRPLMETPNTVIYGPTMDDILMSYTNQDYYEEHPEIWLLTPAETYCIHLLGSREIPSNDPFFTPENSVSAEKEMLHVMEKSTFIAPAQIRGRLVTLSVSVGESGVSSFVVFGLTK